MNWIIVSKDVNPQNPVVKRLLDEAVEATPAGFVKTDPTGETISENTVSMLPKHPVRARCRLCGQVGDLTKEHLPPKSSGNKERLHMLTFDDWLHDKLDANPEMNHKTEQVGVFGYTICRTCNTLTGINYGNEYKDWTERAKKIINGFEPGTLASLNQLEGPFGWEVTFGSKEDGPVRPGAFVRQVLSCMCSLSGSWNLAGRYPELRRIILEQSKEPLPAGLELGFSLYVGPKIRTMGPQLRVDLKTETWRWCQEIAYPPFAFLFVIASNKANPGLGLMMHDWTTLGPDEKQHFTGTVELGFGWSPYPGDYRSEAAIIAKR